MSKQYHPAERYLEPDAEDLRSRLSALRREVNRRVPEFTAVVRRARPREAAGHRRRWLAVAACVALAAAPLLWRVPGRHQRNPGGVSLSEWRSPTDFLLETPGRELLQGVPEIGQWVIDVRPQRRRSPARGWSD